MFVIANSFEDEEKKIIKVPVIIVHEAILSAA